ncbi:hypothetical protein AMS70_10165 [Acinetobacter sp. JS678]|nr:hypothetical protein AMS70_10165 [Acinetobacter sp. JS678]
MDRRDQWFEIITWNLVKTKNSNEIVLVENFSLKLKIFKIYLRFLALRIKFAYIGYVLTNIL